MNPTHTQLYWTEGQCDWWSCDAYGINYTIEQRRFPTDVADRFTLLSGAPTETEPADLDAYQARTGILGTYLSLEAAQEAADGDCHLRASSKQ